MGSLHGSSRGTGGKGRFCQGWNQECRKSPGVAQRARAAGLWHHSPLRQGLPGPPLPPSWAARVAAVLPGPPAKSQARCLSLLPHAESFPNLRQTALDEAEHYSPKQNSSFNRWQILLEIHFCYAAG